MDSYQQPVTSVNRSRKWVENTQRKEILVILISCLDNGGHYNISLGKPPPSRRLAKVK
ncbi:MAG: hypothetical protein BWY82_02642 [Verrucomicrobia bacterium ADurb.Bin474]|nr:MAG: hypothetical protein BWY82_02642 [Verrucomicrobia bacterium ADurb.Bin474]